MKSEHFNTTHRLLFSICEPSNRCLLWPCLVKESAHTPWVQVSCLFLSERDWARTLSGVWLDTPAALKKNTWAWAQTTRSRFNHQGRRDRCALAGDIMVLELLFQQKHSFRFLTYIVQRVLRVRWWAETHAAEGISEENIGQRRTATLIRIRRNPSLNELWGWLVTAHRNVWFLRARSKQEKTEITKLREQRGRTVTFKLSETIRLVFSDVHAPE